MGTQVIANILTVPPGTLPGVPAIAVIPNNPGYITDIVLTIPGGHDGLTGFALKLGGTLVVPYTGSQWVIGDDYTYRWKFGRWVNAGQLQALGYNAGVFPHSFYTYYEWQPNMPGLTAEASLAAATPVPAADLAAVGAITGYDVTAEAAPELQLAGA